MGQISTPALMFVSLGDRVIDPDVAEVRFGQLASQERELIRVTDVEDASNHMLAGEILAPTRTPIVLTEILTFLRRVAE